MEFFYKLFIILLVACATTQANPPSLKITGVIAIKEQPFHSDASAKIIHYTEIYFGSHTIKIHTGKSEYSLDRIKVAGYVNLLITVPDNITNEAELAPLREAFKNISDFSTRYSKSAPILKNYISSLAAHLDEFEKGSRRLRGEWVDKKTMEDMARVEIEKIAEAKKTEEIRVAEIDRLERLRIAEIERVKNLKSAEDARIKSERLKLIDLQRQALNALQKGDSSSALALMSQVSRLSSSPSVKAYVKGVEVFVRISADKSLNINDTNWKNPTLVDTKIYQEIFELIPILSKVDKQDIHPELARLPEGFQAASLLIAFSEDCRQKNVNDSNHPIQALQQLRKSEDYRKLRDSDTFFIKPFSSRLSALDSLISPKAAEYEVKITEAGKLMEGGYFEEATAMYRAALEIESSIELERAIEACMIKATGF